MNPLKFICLIVFLGFIAPQTLWSQEQKKNLETITREEILQMSYDDLLAMPFEDLVTLAGKLGVSIDELLKMKTSVASKTELSPRESPGIISIVTDEEIHNSGAQDLIDVLKLIPGFDFEYDVDGVVGIGFRGNWVHEGKALIMMDGLMMNDLVYYNTPFGNHFDVSQIKRIEIVRGPGSAIYGGNSELCVINIITKNGKDINGISAGISYGQLPENFGRVNGNLQAGLTAGKWDLALKTFLGYANRTTGNYIEDYDSTSVQSNLSKNGSRIESQSVNFSAQRENLSFRFIYDNYNTQCVDSGIPSYNKFRNISSSLQYDLHLSDKLTVTPLLSYEYSKPYNDTFIVSHTYNVDRYKLAIGLNYDASKNINIIAGGEYYRDNGRITDNSFGSYDLNLDNVAFYSQFLWKISGFNLVAGGRGERNNVYGTAFAPRIGITKVFNKFHFKVLASQAFRSPSIGNIDVSDGLKVEKTVVFETEFGYKINDNMFITANLFDINIKNPILYYDDKNSDAVPGVNWGYNNASKLGSNGIELEYRYQYFWGYSSISYSFYTNQWKTVPDYYTAPGQTGSVLGLPKHKITWNAGFKISNDITLAPSLSYSGMRYGYTFDQDGNYGLKNFDPYLLVNLNLSVNDLFIKGLNFNFGVSNILNRQPEFIQPYDGGYLPYPGREREIFTRLVYNFNFK